jgi:hypothetical protein
LNGSIGIDSFSGIDVLNVSIGIISSLDIDLLNVWIGIIATTQPTTKNNLKQFFWGGIIIG